MKEQAKSTKQPQLLEQMDRTDVLSSDLMQIAALIEERLSGYLRKDADTKKELEVSATAPSEPLVPYAALVERTNKKMRDACEKLNDILMRLEA